jgi:glyoxalase family protein
MRESAIQHASTAILGLHHISTVVADFQRTLRFYLGTLDLNLYGLPMRLDGRESMHFYCGDCLKSSTSLLSFIIDAKATQGSAGNGQISAVTFAVPAGSLHIWQERLEGHDVEVIGRAWAFGKEHLCFLDPDGLQLALVEIDDPQRRAAREMPFSDQHVAIQRIHAVEIQVDNLEQTSGFLTETLGFIYLASDGPVARFSHDSMSDFVAIDVLSAPRPRAGVAGIGVINDVVWRVPDLKMMGQIVSAVIDAGQEIVYECNEKEFRAVYFRDPGGINYAVALNCTEINGIVSC